MSVASEKSIKICRRKGTLGQKKLAFKDWNWPSSTFASVRVVIVDSEDHKAMNPWQAAIRNCLHADACEETCKSWLIGSETTSCPAKIIKAPKRKKKGFPVPLWFDRRWIGWCAASWLMQPKGSGFKDNNPTTILQKSRLFFGGPYLRRSPLRWTSKVGRY